MRINDPNNTPISGAGQTSGVTSNDKARIPQPAKGSPSSDQAQLSTLSTYLASVQSDSPARLGRLSDLAGVVSSGGYQVAANLVSGRIIEDSLQSGAGSSI
jgi:hypothetical protein